LSVADIRWNDGGYDDPNFQGFMPRGRLAVDVTLAFGHHEDRAPTHGYEPTREAAMAAFAKSWRRE
jgi:hypothetical protein